MRKFLITALAGAALVWLCGQTARADVKPHALFGNGMVVQRGYKQAANYHIDRLRQMPVGYFFDVMTNGFGSMPDYRSQVTVADRWRIVAYIRALQLSGHATTSDVPADQIKQLNEGASARSGGGTE